MSLGEVYDYVEYFSGAGAVSAALKAAGGLFPTSGKENPAFNFCV